MPPTFRALPTASHVGKEAQGQTYLGSLHVGSELKGGGWGHTETLLSLRGQVMAGPKPWGEFCSSWKGDGGVLPDALGAITTH